MNNKYNVFHMYKRRDIKRYIFERKKNALKYFILHKKYKKKTINIIVKKAILILIMG